MKNSTLKALCVAGSMATTLALPVGSAEKTSGKTNRHKIICPACKAMGSKLSVGDQKIIDHMKASASAADRKTWDAMSPTEKALVTKAVKATFLHGKMSGSKSKK